jgi:hypothetical protein
MNLGMTIDSSWNISLKTDVPEAFSEKVAFVPDAIFVDLQIKLMQPVLDTTETWDAYIGRVYESYIRRCFASASTVIVAFDDYTHVPLAKSMTQQKRRRNIPQIDFSDRDVLPPVVPSKDDWARCMANRTFKTRLIHLITYTLGKRALHDLSPNQTLVIDWSHPPLAFRVGATDAEPLTSLAPLGESDVKFLRYGDMFGNLQVDSVDGDCVPLALLHMEAGFKGNVSIYHLETKVDNPTRKRLVTGEPAPSAKPKRTYEHINIRRLYDGILKRVVPRNNPLPGHEIGMIVSLIGLSGSDFTRSLPQVSGKTLYEYLPEIWGRLVQVYNPDEKALNVDLVADRLVSKIYSLKFGKHCMVGRDGHSYSDVVRQIRASKLSQRTKDAIPSHEVINCNARNINWLLAYWTLHSYPDPVQPMYGFARRGGSICHDD